MVQKLFKFHIPQNLVKTDELIKIKSLFFPQNCHFFKKKRLSIDPSKASKVDRTCIKPFKKI